MSSTEYQIPANGVAEGENKIDIDSSSSGIDSKRDSSDDSFSEVCDEHNETIINLTQFNKNKMNHSNGHDTFEDDIKPEGKHARFLVNNLGGEQSGKGLKKKLRLASYMVFIYIYTYIYYSRIS